MDFDLRMLRHARALAEEGSFARAARTLHLTQPALSRSIQELERRTGIKLFDRNQSRVEPTDLGRVFLAQARELLGRAEALEREVATMRGSGTGHLVVGSGTFPTAIFMGQAVSAFLSRNPRVGIRVLNDNWVALVAALRRRELDFIVTAQPVADESTDLSIQPLATRQGRFLVRPGHPLLVESARALADVVAYPLVCTSRFNPAMMEALLAARNDGGGGRMIPDVACESHEMMRCIVASTDHVMISTLGANARAIDAGELAPLPFADPRIASTFAVIRVESRTLPPIADELIGDIIAADRASVAAERALAARIPDASAGRATARPGRTREAARVAAR
jgi:DNA-binding transcriptional LysR family regulator